MLENQCETRFIHLLDTYTQIWYTNFVRCWALFLRCWCNVLFTNVNTIVVVLCAMPIFSALSNVRTYILLCLNRWRCNVQKVGIQRHTATRQRQRHKDIKAYIYI